jgi:hypothetical protein
MNLDILTRKLIVVALLVVASVPALAQSIAIAPAQIVQTFKPGVPFEVTLSTNNTGAAPVQMSVEITDFWYDQKSDKTFPPSGSSPHSAANWIQFVPERFEVAPGASQKMKAIITPPEDARGGYYAVLFVSSAPKLSDDKTESGGAVFTRMRLGCLVMLEAEKTQDYKVEFGEMKVDAPTATEPLVVHIPIANNSNTHIFPQPRITVLDADRKMVGKAEADSKRFLPGQKYTMDLKWSGDLKPGNYSGVVTVTYGRDKVETRVVPFTVAAQ